MRFDEVKDMLIQVITTWQVIAISVAVILYFFLVSYVARAYHRTRRPGVSKRKKRKSAASAPVAVELEDTSAAASAGNEGFEEEIITEE